MKTETRSALSAAGERIKQDIRQYGAGILTVVFLYFLLHALFDAFCPSVLITGFPCPGCGMTRAALFLLRGQFARSWALNPAAGLWMLWTLWGFFDRYFRNRKSGGFMWAAAGIALFMVVIYLVRMKMFFPNKPPYVYTRNNLFARVSSGYGQAIKKLSGR